MSYPFKQSIIFSLTSLTSLTAIGRWEKAPPHMHPCITSANWTESELTECKWGIINLN